eukprot:Hpha_TRINITY_DN17228_c0_g1::TRINITY_DN17228_c0_g1_i1::g.17792::m.17792
MGAALVLGTLVGSLPPCVRRLRSRSPVQNHPLIGSTLSRSDAAKLIQSAFADDSSRFPASQLGCPHLQVLYLALQEEGVERPLWMREVEGGVVEISGSAVKGDRERVIHFPGGGEAELLNVLVGFVADQERKQGWAYDYVVFARRDTLLHGNYGIAGFNQFLDEFRPAIGVPLSRCSPQITPSGVHRPLCARALGGGPFATSLPTSAFAAYHRNAISMLWPLDVQVDNDVCPITSRWVQQVRAQLLFPRGMLVHASLTVESPDEQASCETWHYSCGAAHALAGKGASSASPLLFPSFRMNLRGTLDAAKTAGCFRPNSQTCSPPNLERFGGRNYRNYTVFRQGAATQQCIDAVTRVLSIAYGGHDRKSSTNDECRSGHVTCILGAAAQNMNVAEKLTTCSPPNWPPDPCPCRKVCKPGDQNCADACKKFAAAGGRVGQGVPGGVHGGLHMDAPVRPKARLRRKRNTG